MKTPWRFWTAVAVVACAAWAGPAAAQNAKTYHGSSCQAYSENETTLFRHDLSGIVNAKGGSTFSNYIACPVVVDETGGTAGTSVIALHWTANGASDRLDCAFYSMNGNGTVRQVKSASKTGSGWLTLPNITSDDTLGSYYMLCSLPRLGTLNTIKVEEQL